MIFVYDLKSISHNLICIGMTDNLKSRIIRHNRGYVKSAKAFKPLELFYFEKFADKTEARGKEMFLKSAKEKGFLILFSCLKI